MSDAIVWITGASAGIGAALAATVPFPDAHVVDISRSGGTPETDHLPADLTDPLSWRAVEADLHARMSAFRGRRAVFVSNAGTVEPVGFAGEVDSETYRRNVLLNSAAPQVLGHAFLTALRVSGFAGAAHLVLVSSGAASRQYPGWSGYCAGKAAGDHWVRTVGLEQQSRQPGGQPGGQQGGRPPVNVVAVTPGVVDTAMQERLRAADPADFPDVRRFLDLHDSGALRTPLDAARDVWATVLRAPQPGAVLSARGA